MPKICHISDLHGQFTDLPKADIYVASGDLLDNHPIIVRPKNFYDSRRIIDHAREAEQQALWFYNNFGHKGHSLREFLGSPDAPVVCVRGNHDFIDLGPLFGGEVFELDHDPSRTVEYCGLKFGGFRGVNYIYGEWADELSFQELDDRVARLPRDLDVVVTHTPPYGVLDGERHLGLSSLTTHLNTILYDLNTEDKLPKLFCFGHIHESKGLVEKEAWFFDDRKILFSNASLGKNVIEL